MNLTETTLAKLLVIDDNQDFREMVVQTLLEAGFEVVTAIHGKDGLKVLAESPVDLVVTDLVMPEMEGIETLTAIRKRYPKIPVIAVSGGGPTGGDYLNFARNLGASYAFAKPLQMDRFLSAVRECTDGI